MPDTPWTAAQLAAAFLAASGASAAPADLGDRLLALVVAARAAHPKIRLDDGRFARHLARHVPDDEPLDAWLGAICAEDLYLACACADGMPAAIEAFDRQYLSQVGAFIARLPPAPDFVEEVAQAVRERLLVGAEGSPPRIADYSGRARLERWLRVVTVRVALSMRRHTEPVPMPPLSQRPSSPSPPVDPFGDPLERRYQDDLNAALRAAVGALTGEQRDLLRMHYVEGATLEQIAAKVGVGRVTVARRLAAAQQEILAVARRQLGEKLGLGSAELERLLGVMRGRRS